MPDVKKLQEAAPTESKSVTVVGVLNASPSGVPWLPTYPSTSLTIDPASLIPMPAEGEAEQEEPTRDWGFGTHIREAISAIKEIRRR